MNNINDKHLANNARVLIESLTNKRVTIASVISEWNVCVNQAGFTGVFDFPTEGYSRKAQLIADLTRCAEQLEFIAIDPVNTPAASRPVQAVVSKVVKVIAFAAVLCGSVAFPAMAKIDMNALDGAWSCGDGSAVIIATSHEPDFSNGIISFESGINIINKNRELAFSGGVASTPDSDPLQYGNQYFSKDMTSSVQVKYKAPNLIYVQRLVQTTAGQFGYTETKENPLICEEE